MGEASKLCIPVVGEASKLCIPVVGEASKLCIPVVGEAKRFAVITTFTNNIMRHLSFFLSLLVSLSLLLPSCEKDDSSFSDYDFSKYSLRSEQGDDGDGDGGTLPDTIALTIVWSGSGATVTGASATDSVTVAQGTTASDIVVTSTTQRYLQIAVSGTSTGGSLLVYSERRWGLVMNALTLTNPDGPAINNQCGKALYVTIADGTVNTLTDGTAYADAPTNAAGAAIDQKGTFFSEGQMYFSGKGTLQVTGNSKNAIACDDYIVIEEDGPTLGITAKGTNGIKVNDGMEIYGGMLTIGVTSAGGRGIRSEARVTIGGGETTITTSGDCAEETLADGTTDYSSCAGIKSDSLFTMTAGTLTIASSGDGGKGINCSQDVEFKGGRLNVTTTGSNNYAKPKGVKSGTGIIVSGGSFSVTVEKSWACDNGTDSSDIEGMLTIIGTPATRELEKKSVTVIYSDN